MGAPDPRDGESKKLTGLSDAARAHWAFQSVKKPLLPVVNQAAWCENDVDRFVLQKMEASGLVPNVAAKPDALLRRLFYDLWVCLPHSTKWHPSQRNGCKPMGIARRRVCF